MALKVNLGKTNVVFSCGITKESLSKRKICPCEVYSLRVKANSVLCVQCGKWIHSRCARVKRVTSKFYGKCEGNIGEAVVQEEKLCNEVETVSKFTVREFTYLGVMASAGAGCDAVVTARTC